MIARMLFSLLVLTALFAVARAPDALAQAVAPPPPAPIAPAAPVAPAAAAEVTAEVPTLRLPLGLGSGSLDPHSARDPVTFGLCAAVFDTLYSQLHPLAGAHVFTFWPRPAPKVSPDGLTWTT